MKPKAASAALFVVLGLASIACGPSEAELDATSTAIASSIFATQTAQAPTATPIPTDTPQPTPTPTTTSTLTPTPTKTRPPTPIPTDTPVYPIPAGWRDHATERFSLALPEGWETIDVDKEGIASILNILKGLQSDWAQNVVQMLSTEAIQESIKFWAMDTRPAGVGYANVNVIFQSMPVVVSSADLCVQLPSAYKQMGIKLLETKCGLEINRLQSDRFTLSLRAGPFTIRQYSYVYVQGRNMWTLSLGVDESQWSKYQPVFVAIAESFRLNQ